VNSWNDYRNSIGHDKFFERICVRRISEKDRGHDFQAKLTNFIENKINLESNCAKNEMSSDLIFRVYTHLGIFDAK
jgi:hypothetical protein